MQIPHREDPGTPVRNGTRDLLTVSIDNNHCATVLLWHFRNAFSKVLFSCQFNDFFFSRNAKHSLWIFYCLLSAAMADSIFKSSLNLACKHQIVTKHWTCSLPPIQHVYLIPSYCLPACSSFYHDRMKARINTLLRSDTPHFIDMSKGMTLLAEKSSGEGEAHFMCGYFSKESN